MKTFYDLQDIKTDIDVSISLSSVCDNGDPFTKVCINNRVLYNDILSKKIVLTDTINIHSPVHISVTLSDKIYSSELETAVIIDSITCDDIELIPQCLHTVVYNNDHNQPSTTNYLGYNGTWSLDITMPFYHWYHQLCGHGLLIYPGTKKSTKPHQKILTC
jgi:hypothetical protein